MHYGTKNNETWIARGLSEITVDRAGCMTYIWCQARMSRRNGAKIMTQSAFVSWLSDNARLLPAALVAELKAEARNRLAARWQAGRGDVPLCFRDLAMRGETALAGQIRAT